MTSQHREEEKERGHNECFHCGEQDPFMTLCDYHYNNPDQQGSMNCWKCNTCDECKVKP